MFSQNKNTYTRNEVTEWPIPNQWDIVALIFVLGAVALLGFGAKQMLGHFELGQTIPISLNPIHLPYYALRTVLRMLVALVISILFTFIFGTWAAKSKEAERIIIPMIDILQSVPVLGFLSITVVGFIVLFRGSMLGPECAAIFAIFVAQVWNMTLSFYQSLKTIPHEMNEAADMFQLSAWQKFWRVDVPFAMPGLIWNMMLSMSASWVFLVFAEAFPVADHSVTLPGIGSYIALAISNKNVHAIYYVIIAMFIVIALYDQLLFRPLVAWSEKFKVETEVDEEEAESWLLDLFQQTYFLRFIGSFLSRLGEEVVNFYLFRKKRTRRYLQPSAGLQKLMWVFRSLLIIFIAAAALLFLIRFLFDNVETQDVWQAIYLGGVTALRVMILIVISSIIWVPLGAVIGLNKKASRIVQPVAQFLAAFPVNLLFPFFALMIVKYNLNVNIWTSPLMILGTQWYILFNVVAGAKSLPQNMRHAVGTLNVRGWLWWKRFILPGVFPYYITGAITAAGGAWNISIMAETIEWGHIHLRATGLGAYITQAYNQNHFPNLVLGITVMTLYVLAFNRFLWKPLYNLAQERFQIR